MKSFEKLVDETNLLKLNCSIFDALQSDNAKQIEDVMLKVSLMREDIQHYASAGNSTAKILLSFYSTKLLTDLANRAYKVKEPLNI